MEQELNNFVKVWITTILCLCYCRYIVSRLIPSGWLRLVSFLPVFYLFITMPLTLLSFHLGGPTTFFLTWLGIFKLTLFAFNLGPLSPPPASLFHFISIACLPIKIKHNPDPKQTLKSNTNNSIVLAVKALLLGLVVHSYNYRPVLPSYAIIALYCCHMYLGLDIILALAAAPVQALFDFDLEPQFDEPYLSTSLQDFWGRRWNLMVTNILRPTVYDPIKHVVSCLASTWWARLVATMVTFAVSGLMHEIIYYYMSRVGPTWEVTWFFVMHGVFVVVEVEVKKAVKGKWSLHPVISGPLSLVFLAVTANWLFFPQLIRNGVVTKAIGEYGILGDFVKAKLPHLYG